MFKVYYLRHLPMVLMCALWLKGAHGGALLLLEKGQLNKYNSACLCNIENPTNNLVSVLEPCAMCIDITLH